MDNFRRSGALSIAQNCAPKCVDENTSGPQLDTRAATEKGALRLKGTTSASSQWGRNRIPPAVLVARLGYASVERFVQCPRSRRLGAEIGYHFLHQLGVLTT